VHAKSNPTKQHVNEKRLTLKQHTQLKPQENNEWGKSDEQNEMKIHCLNKERESILSDYGDKNASKEVSSL
jgi:hypothetical protein